MPDKIESPAPASQQGRAQDVKAWSALDILDLIERLAKTQDRLRQRALAFTSNAEDLA